MLAIPLLFSCQKSNPNKSGTKTDTTGGNSTGIDTTPKKKYYVTTLAGIQCCSGRSVRFGKDDFDGCSGAGVDVEPGLQGAAKAFDEAHPEGFASAGLVVVG
jgi:hypothetical protein